MKISLDWISDYIDLPSDVKPRRIADELTLKTVEVETCTHLADVLDRVIVAVVREMTPLSGALHSIECDAGPLGALNVVTRAANLSEDCAVTLALPGAVIHGRTVAAVQVGGQISQAYLCRAADLGLELLFPGTAASDALLLDELGAGPGDELAGCIGWDDWILEIDNKSLTNRPDLWGHYGIARELSAILHLPLKPLPSAVVHPQAAGLIGAVDPELCRRYVAVEFEWEDDVRSPLWLRSRLARLGERSISLTVDIGNYVMFAVGQPVHVFDREKVTVPLSVSRAADGHSMRLLDGGTAPLTARVPVICDAHAPTAVAGIMGGANSAASAGTNRYLLEAATFDARTVRRATQQLGLRTEAATRFEKQVDTQRVDQAVALYTHLLGQVAPAARVCGLEDRVMESTMGKQISVGVSYLQARIGCPLELTAIRATLSRLGFEVESHAVAGDYVLTVHVPSWRATGDIAIPEDILEEIARIHGYDRLRSTDIRITLQHVPPQDRKSLDRRMREQLATRAGMYEVVTYPWSADAYVSAAGLDPAAGVSFQGAPSPDRARLRSSLVPNLLETVERNRRYARSFEIFELGTVFSPQTTAPDKPSLEGLPQQPLHLAAALAGEGGAALFLKAKGALEMLGRVCHLTDLSFGQPKDGTRPGWADDGAMLAIFAGGVRAGTLGLLGTRAKRLASLSQSDVALFELNLAPITAHVTRENRYRPLSEFPESDFDLSVLVPEKLTWGQIKACVLAVGGLVDRVDYRGDFRGGWVPEGRKSTTLHVILRPRDTTLTGADIAEARDAVLAALTRAFGAAMRA